MSKDENLTANLTGAMDYEKLIAQIELLSGRYSDLHTGYIGASILDKAIPVLTLGNPRASKSVVYLGGLSAEDSILSAVLLRFVNDYFSFLESGRRMYSVNLNYLFERRRIYIVPMLNCDGCTIRLNGCGESILKDRLLAMNNGEESFREWLANARGVDLRYNFACGFENRKAESARAGTDLGGRCGYCGTSPESEPETASFCNYLRMNGGTALLVNLHMNGNGLSYPCQGEGEAPIPRIRTVGRLLARMSGTAVEKKADPMGSVEDWFANELRQPAFSVGCRYSDLEGNSDDAIKIYAYLRETLFSAPLLV